MKRVASGHYEMFANGHNYEVLKSDSSSEWMAFKDKIVLTGPQGPLGPFKTYRDAREAVTLDSLGGFVVGTKNSPAIKEDENVVPESEDNIVGEDEDSSGFTFENSQNLFTHSHL